MDRRLVERLIQNEQWDEFKAYFPDIDALSAFTTRDNKSILHLVARFASPTFAQKVIRFYHLDNKDSFVAKELWARRDKAGELCVNFERFKKYFNKPFLDKVEAVYSGRYFKKPDEKWPLEKQTSPRVEVYKLLRRYALRAAFDGSVQFQKSFPDGVSPVFLFLPAMYDNQRCLAVGFNVKSRRPFLKQLYEQLDCPEEAMSPMLASVYTLDKTIKNLKAEDRDIQEAFKYFQEKQGVFIFENGEVSCSPDSEMTTELNCDVPLGITVNCPRRQDLPASFNEVLQNQSEYHWVYETFSEEQQGKHTKENFWHELVHVVDLTQQYPFSETPLFIYSVLCLMSSLKSEDAPVKNVIKEVLSLYSSSQLFGEYASFLVAHAGPSDNIWVKKMRQFVSFTTAGVRVPAVSNRIFHGLFDWKVEDMDRMEQLVSRFKTLHTKKCPRKGMFLSKGTSGLAQWQAYMKSVNHLLKDFFSKNKDLAPKVLRSLNRTMDVLPVLTQNSTTLGSIVLSEGWLNLLKEHPIASMPEQAVLDQIVQLNEPCSTPPKTINYLSRLIDSCSPQIKSDKDIQVLLQAVMCAHRAKVLTQQEFINENMSLENADYTQLKDGTVLNHLKKYTSFLIRRQSEQQRPLKVAQRPQKKKQLVREKED